jgi:hypothetical protein
MKLSELEQYTRGYKLDAKKAVSIICQDDSIDGLHPETRAAIAFMLRKTESKAANKKELTNPFWLAAKFMAKKDVRYYLNYIYSDGNTLTASTGHVLIQVSHKCEPGFYDRLGNLVESPEFAKFPNCERLLADVSNPKPFDISDFKDAGFSGKVSVVSTDDETFFNTEYFALLTRIKADSTVTVTDKVLIFTGPAYIGCIMPIRK